VHSGRVSRRRPLLAAVLLTLLGGLLVGPADAGDKVLSGTIEGEDGKAVSALLGFDLRDAKGRTLGASGCVRSPSCPVDGYAVTRRVNFALDEDGARSGARRWTVRLPEETERVYVEAYPQGRGYAGTNTDTYAASFRRNLPVPYGRDVNLRLAGVCDRDTRGRTGAVLGYAVEDGSDRRVPLQRVTAFSLEPDDNDGTPILGTGVGTVAPGGRYVVDDLVSDPTPGARPGQRYQLVATAVDGRVSRVYDVRVTACRATTRNIVF
jgi:hypothetical protein